MKKASTYLTPEQRTAIERSIADAEKKTSAEIVVVLATQSGRYDRAEDLFGILCGLVAVAAAWILWQDFGPSHEDWAVGNTLALGLGGVLVIFLCWFMLGTVLATFLPRLSRLFISHHEIEAEVRRRGFEAFHLFRVGNTKARNGLLIYVSLMERMAWVVGDDAIHAKLPRETWSEASRAIASGFRRGRHERGLTEAVAICGAALAPHFPRHADDANELPNRVRIMD